MTKAISKVAGAVLVTAAAFCVNGTAFAGGPGGPGKATDNPFSALAGKQLSAAKLGTARGEGGVNLTNAFNTTNNQLNVTSSSSGTLNGKVSGGSTTGDVIGGAIGGNTGFTNVFSNTGNNVMMNSSVSIFISAQ
ncbi:hypothetical protein [Acidiphilium iwatense]|uniref:Uncharacterized protein n=1 Tax=Acidiphilium iwatense TaxID=768198 RepID=A0ABS9DU85_9PROT|nr:hypothetical protein [Acidiphilium iwatense]MCF3946291.1 hypothetical protein [Acidiphilium iwatense]